MFEKEGVYAQWCSLSARATLSEADFKLKIKCTAVSTCHIRIKLTSSNVSLRPESVQTIRDGEPRTSTPLSHGS